MHARKGFFGGPHSAPVARLVFLISEFGYNWNGSKKCNAKTSFIPTSLSLPHDSEGGLLRRFSGDDNVWSDSRHEFAVYAALSTTV